MLHSIKLLMHTIEAGAVGRGLMTECYVAKRGSNESVKCCYIGSCWGEAQIGNYFRCLLFESLSILLQKNFFDVDNQNEIVRISLLQNYHTKFLKNQHGADQIIAIST